MSSTISLAPAVRRAAGNVMNGVEQVVGGPARARVVVLLACVLALESADLSTVGAAGPELESAFHISNSGLGLLAAISTLVGAITTVPVGALTDRVRRVSLLAGAVGLWAVAMVASAAAQDYEWLLISRLGLGVVTAAAGPVIASLTGDYFPAAERGKIYGYILSGELLGAGVGFVISGSLASAIGWRWAFAVLTLPAVALALAIWRALPEPARGGQSHIAAGDERIVDAEEANRRGLEAPSEKSAGEQADELARRAILKRRVEPIEENVLRADPRRMTLRQAVRYVLSIRTTRWIIAASAIGYFFFAGMRTFAVVFVRGHLEVGQAAATMILFLAGLGSLAGVLIAGRVADRMIRGGRVNARLIVGGVAYVVAAALLAPALLIPSIAVSGPILVLSAAALAAPNPPMDAARLDIMPGRRGGRAGRRPARRCERHAAARHRGEHARPAVRVPDHARAARPKRPDPAQGATELSRRCGNRDRLRTGRRSERGLTLQETGEHRCTGPCVRSAIG
jgi:predicted MFS family arabinose efflux permease